MIANVGPQKLYLFPLSFTQVPLPTGGAMTMVSGSYLIVMGDGKHLLIDSGFPADVSLTQGVPTPAEERHVVDHLAALNLQPDVIDMVICTHFDVDHVGYHEVFQHAEFIVQREHYDIARGGHPRYAAGRAHWDHPLLRYRMVEGDTEIVPGVRVVETSGHAPGHQSVLVSLPVTGPVLLAIDAVVMQRLFTVERRAWPLDDDEAQLRASTRKLLDLVAHERVQLVVFGHDGEQWRTLTTAPGYYE